MDRKLHLLETFAARGNDGSTYKVCAYEHMARDLSLSDGMEHWEPTGVAEYRLDSGERVDVQPDGSFVVPDRGLQLKPAASAHH